MGNTVEKPLAGSIFRADNDTLWYCYGSWRPVGVQDALPCILGYVPDTGEYEGIPRTKILELEGKRYIKAFGVPIDFYKERFLAGQSDLIEPQTFGRLAFLSSRRIVEMRDPQAFTSRYISEVPEDGVALRRLCEYLGTELSSIGISGSSLLFNQPVRRHEIDIFLYGRELSRNSLRLIEQGKVSGVLRRVATGAQQPFILEGVSFDPHYAEGENEGNLIDNSAITIEDRIDQVTLQISDDSDGLFFPSIYGVDGDKKLISFRPGHISLFQQGEQLLFRNLNRMRMVLNDGSRVEGYAILDDQWGEVLSSKNT